VFDLFSWSMLFLCKRQMQENNENVNDQSSEEDPSHKTT
jgi:hypothetical protein